MLRELFQCYAQTRCTGCSSSNVLKTAYFFSLLSVVSKRTIAYHGSLATEKFNQVGAISSQLTCTMVHYDAALLEPNFSQS